MITRSDYKKDHFQSIFINFDRISTTSTTTIFQAMNFTIIIVFLAQCISGARLDSARLGFHGSKYHYGQFGNLSPRQVAILKKVMQIKCQRKHGRFC